MMRISKRSFFGMSDSVGIAATSKSPNLRKPFEKLTNKPDGFIGAQVLSPLPSLKLKVEKEHDDLFKHANGETEGIMWWSNMAELDIWAKKESLALEMLDVVESIGEKTDLRSRGVSSAVITLGVSAKEYYDSDLETSLRIFTRKQASTPGLLCQELFRPRNLVYLPEIGQWQRQPPKGDQYYLKSWWRSKQDIDNHESFSKGLNAKSVANGINFSLFEVSFSTEHGSDHQAQPTHGIFTSEQLSDYKSGNKIYVAIKGDVFDVSNSKDFYGPGKPYNVFAGRDATRGFAKMILDEKEQRPVSLEELTDDEKVTLNEWYDKFKSKYPIVGKLENAKL